MNPLTEVIEADAQDAARYRYIVRNRNWHLLKLLADGKGDEKQFHACVDRCLASEEQIRKGRQCQP